MSRSSSEREERNRVFRWAAQNASVILTVDPDLHSPGVALVGSVGYPIWVGCPKSTGKGLSGLSQLAKTTQAAIRDLLDRHPAASSAYGPCLLVVEAMRVRQGAGAETKNPQSLVDISAAGSLVSGLFCSALQVCEVVYVEPSVWKGSVPKPIHQARTYSRLDWGYKQLKEYSRPVAPEVSKQHGLRASDWKHVGDALGLGLWAVDQIRDQIKWNKLRDKRG